jgi:pyrroloquinoline quinone (PQQ) biosynthesis protein C
MDDAPWHNKEKIEQLCAAAGIKLLIIPLSVSDINPLKGCFAEIRAFARKHFMEHKYFAGKDFKSCLEMCVKVVRSRTKSARNHFRRAGLLMEDDSQLEYDSE